MNWRKMLLAFLIVATVVLFVITMRQHDTNTTLKHELGQNYSMEVQNFRSYVEDLQSATDSGDLISTNHFYSEMNNFPIKNEQLITHMNNVYNQLDTHSDGKSLTTEQRKKLSSDLNTLQLTLIDIISYSDNKASEWYKMVQTKDRKLQTLIDSHFK